MKPVKVTTILVTAVGGDMGQSAVKCLNDRDRNHRIIGCDMNPYAGGRDLCSHFISAPPVKEEARYKQFLENTITQFDVKYIFPMSDIEINFLNHKRSLVERIGAVPVMNPAHIVDRFMDKLETVRFFNTHQIPAPDTYLAEEYAGRLGFPLIMKKQRGSGSQGLFKINDEEELRFYLKRYKGMILQQYLPGDDAEYTACIFCTGMKRFFITFKRQLAPGGFSGIVELVREEVIDNFLNRVADALDFVGSLNVQFRIVDGMCMPFEINPRFSSTIYFRHCFGFKDMLWSIDSLEGKTIEYTPQYKKGIGVKRYDEVFFDMN